MYVLIGKMIGATKTSSSTLMIHKLSFTTEIVGQIWLSLISIQQQKCILYSEIFFENKIQFSRLQRLGEINDCRMHGMKWKILLLLIINFVGAYFSKTAATTTWPVVL